MLAARDMTYGRWCMSALPADWTAAIVERAVGFGLGSCGSAYNLPMICALAAWNSSSSQCPRLVHADQALQLRDDSALG